MECLISKHSGGLSSTKSFATAKAPPFTANSRLCLQCFPSSNALKFSGISSDIAASFDNGFSDLFELSRHECDVEDGELF